MSLTILCGDAIEQLRTLPDESVQGVVTSPPYWGLRDYGTGTWGGGDAACDHVKGEMRRGVNLAQSVHNTRGGAKKCAEVENVMFGATCGKCGAVRIDKQIGLEKTPEEFVTKMVAVFAEVRRVLKADGTCWVNLGDSYANDAKWGGSSGGKHVASLHGKTGIGRQKVTSGLKPKDMVGMPWRVAFALQAAGWYLRQDIIWHKPNPMPESVADRCTKAHEYLFLLTKSERYYYDAEAIKEPVTGGAHVRGNGVNPKANSDMASRRPSGWAASDNGDRKGRYPQPRQNASFSGSVNGLVENRNKRSVWTVPTFAFSEAHFATYPPALITPCILAGTKPGDTVLDPFAGSGTTGQVAIGLGRSAILIELNPEYVKLIERRCDVTPGLAL